ncbi:hypothetical protein GQ53DRAFT_53014 [Thozetella sp. PMI_491]|nr:hypothetical protein GQ53DRAFT_53014 [Thozetella sp. PMI_491]
MMARVAALNLTEIPTCATPCFLDAFPETSCDPLDTPCLCLDAKYNQLVESCVRESCTVKEALVTKRITWLECDFPLSDKSRTTLLMQVLLFTLESLAFLTRLVSKVMKLSPWWWDDTTIAIAYVSKIGFLIASFFEQENGNGQDLWMLTPTQITAFLRLFFAFEILYAFSIGAVKASLLFFFIRVFPEGNCSKLLWITQAFNLAVTVVFIAVTCFQCIPLSFFWDGWDGEHNGTCINIAAMAWSHGGIQIALDIWMLMLPAWQILRMSIPWRKKLWVLFVFGVGIFLTIASIIRQKSIVGFTQTENVTVGFFDVALWSCIELTTGIVVACIPAAHQLRKKFIPHIFSSCNGSRNPTPASFGASPKRTPWPTPIHIHTIKSAGYEELHERHNGIHLARYTNAEPPDGTVRPESGLKRLSSNIAECPLPGTAL